MTTAHRPTFHPAVGRAVIGGYNYSAGRGDKKVSSSHAKLKTRVLGQDSVAEVSTRDLKTELLLRETEHYESVTAINRRNGLLLHDFDDADENISTSGSESDSSGDDEQLLRLELEQIQREKDSNSLATTDVGSDHVVLSYTNSDTHFMVKRRWDDDVVFRNQVRSEPLPKQRFLNDTIRNDFHVKFLKRYIQ